MRAHRRSRDRLPLAAGRKRRAAAADELRVGDLPDHALGPERQRPAQRGVAAVRAIVVQACRIDDADAPQQPQSARLAARRGLRRATVVRSASPAACGRGRPRRARVSTGDPSRRRRERPVGGCVARRAERAPPGARSHSPRHGLRSHVACTVARRRRRRGRGRASIAPQRPRAPFASTRCRRTRGRPRAARGVSASSA